METDPLLWLPGSFYRRPDWRWLRAEYLLATGQRWHPAIDDRWVVDACNALGADGGSDDTTAAILAARVVWAADMAVKWELEARLLTVDSLDRIAELCRLPGAVVAAYGELFFDVRPMRAATDWLMRRAVGYSAVSGFTGTQPAGVWKLAALTGGTGVLDVVIAATTGRPLSKEFSGGAGPRGAYAEARLRLLARLWVAVVAASTDAEVAGAVAARERLGAVDADVYSEPGSVPPATALLFLKALPGLNRRGLPEGHRSCRQEPSGASFQPREGCSDEQEAREPGHSDRKQGRERERSDPAPQAERPAAQARGRRGGQDRGAAEAAGGPGG